MRCEDREKHASANNGSRNQEGRHLENLLITLGKLAPARFWATSWTGKNSFTMALGCQGDGNDRSRRACVNSDTWQRRESIYVSGVSSLTWDPSRMAGSFCERQPAARAKSGDGSREENALKQQSKAGSNLIRTDRALGKAQMY
jgi:hypothetical protein